MTPEQRELLNAAGPLIAQLNDIASRFHRSVAIQVGFDKLSEYAGVLLTAAEDYERIAEAQRSPEDPYGGLMNEEIAEKLRDLHTRIVGL